MRCTFYCNADVFLRVRILFVLARVKIAIVLAMNLASTFVAKDRNCSIKTNQMAIVNSFERESYGLSKNPLSGNNLAWFLHLKFARVFIYYWYDFIACPVGGSSSYCTQSNTWLYSFSSTSIHFLNEH